MLLFLSAQFANLEEKVNKNNTQNTGIHTKIMDIRIYRLRLSKL